jgi:hypothetical protein
MSVPFYKEKEVEDDERSIDKKMINLNVSRECHAGRAAACPSRASSRLHRKSRSVAASTRDMVNACTPGVAHQRFSLNHTPTYIAADCRAVDVIHCTIGHSSPLSPVYQVATSNPRTSISSGIVDLPKWIGTAGGSSPKSSRYLSTTSAAPEAAKTRAIARCRLQARGSGNAIVPPSFPLPNSISSPSLS